MCHGWESSPHDLQERARVRVLIRAACALLCGALSFSLLLDAGPAGEAGAAASMGYLEVCKAADNPGVAGTFTFDVAGRAVTSRWVPARRRFRSPPATCGWSSGPSRASASSG